MAIDNEKYLNIDIKLDETPINIPFNP